MKKRVIKSSVWVIRDKSELSKKDQQLLNKAKKALDNSYSPYSNFQVGAAVRLKNGKTFSGSNQENAAYPMCLCAERVALSAAESVFAKVPVKTIAITARNLQKIIDSPIAPCGSCRQALCETEYKHQQRIKVIMQGEKGKIYVLESAKDLLPLAFDGSFL